MCCMYKFQATTKNGIKIVWYRKMRVNVKQTGSLKAVTAAATAALTNEKKNEKQVCWL